MRVPGLVTLVATAAVLFAVPANAAAVSSSRAIGFLDQQRTRR
ncbi:MAG: hypothetical protein WD649_06310 [Thermoleophilaceae bacterium]